MDFYSSLNFTASLVVPLKYLEFWLKLHCLYLLKKTYIFVIWLHSIQEHEMSLHLFRSSFMSLARILKYVRKKYLKLRNTAPKVAPHPFNISGRPEATGDCQFLHCWLLVNVLSLSEVIHELLGFCLVDANNFVSDKTNNSKDLWSVGIHFITNSAILY